MTRTLFITGTDTGVGKTVLTALLARFLREQGVRVGAFKPVCSGSRNDARLLYRALNGTLALDEINPWHFRAPIAPVLAAQREGRTVRLTQVLAHLCAMRAQFDVLLVEGAGGLLSPLGLDFDSRDLISALRATPVIVAPNRLGTVNHVLLTLEALPKNLRVRAKVILMTPSKADSATASNPRLLKHCSGREVYCLPWFGKRPSAGAMLEGPLVRRVLTGIAGLKL